jgi:uncharacterized protein (TIGR00730 family)
MTGDGDEPPAPFFPDIRMSVSVVVFCGAREGRHPAWREAAVALGTGLARAGIRLIYGGGRLGLMGVVADAALDAGGEVMGIIPEFLTTMEVAHDRVTNLVVTDSMHSRKRRMFELADAFITMPGGLGTLDETVEIITWRQLGLHEKPVLICNVAGWADALLAAFETTVTDGFASPSARGLYHVVPDVEAALSALKTLPSQHLPGQSLPDAHRL